MQGSKSYKANISVRQPRKVSRNEGQSDARLGCGPPYFARLAAEFAAASAAAICCALLCGSGPLRSSTHTFSTLACNAWPQS